MRKISLMTILSFVTSLSFAGSHAPDFGKPLENMEQACKEAPMIILSQINASRKFRASAEKYEDIPFNKIERHIGLAREISTIYANMCK